MKKIIVLFVLLFTYISLSPVNALADILPPNSHYVEVCSKIINLDKFPNLVLFGYITGPQVWGENPYKIESDKCLTKGYKFNSLGIYWITKNKFNSLNIKDLKPTDMTLLLKDSISDGGYFPDASHILKENIEYSIVDSSNGAFVIYKTKQTSEYNDGTPNKVETFNNSLEQNEIIPAPVPKQKPTPNPIPEPTGRGFWGSVSCFFVELFGGICK